MVFLSNLERDKQITAIDKRDITCFTLSIWFNKDKTRVATPTPRAIALKIRDIVNLFTITS